MGRTEKLYSDREVEINELGIRLPFYYFPIGVSKFIPWSSIKEIRVENLSVKNGLWRIWGMNLNCVWYNPSLTRRWSKSQLSFIIDNGNTIRPGFTPKNSELVLEALVSNAVSIDRSAIE